ncbi:unnamed protein product, partial [Toxocara canis]|uniref:PHM7_cyt domain-containing protein n=1 Tax=Toxocara canis TaxID=6265 RepID=A0A183UY03_TOXCA
INESVLFDSFSRKSPSGVVSIGSAEAGTFHLERLMEESASRKQNCEPQPVAQPAKDGRKKIVLGTVIAGKSRDKTLLDESFSDAEIDAAIYSVTERSKFTGEKRTNLITALRRTLIGEITFTEAVSNYGICVTTFSPYIMKAREELRKIATQGNEACGNLYHNSLLCCDDRKHKRYQVFEVPEKWKGNHTGKDVILLLIWIHLLAALKNAIMTSAREYGGGVGGESSSFMMSMALMDVLSGDCSLYRAAIKHQTHSQKHVPSEEHVQASSSAGSCESDLSRTNRRPCERITHLMPFDENSSGEEFSGCANGTNGFATHSTSHSMREHAVSDLEKRVNAYFSSRVGFKNSFFGITDEEQLSKIKKVAGKLHSSISFFFRCSSSSGQHSMFFIFLVVNALRRSAVVHWQRLFLTFGLLLSTVSGSDVVSQFMRVVNCRIVEGKKSVEVVRVTLLECLCITNAAQYANVLYLRVIRSRVTVTAAAARTSISTGTIRPYVHEALQLLEQLSVSPSPEELLQKHSSCMVCFILLFDGTSCENSAVNEAFDIADVKKILNELLEVSALDEDGRRKIFETVLRVRF